jgi:hypothetical protein
MPKLTTTARSQVAQDAAPTLAAHVAAILAHPDTPACLYNALAEAVCELDAPPRFFDSAAYVEICLAGAFAARGVRSKKGGAR